MKRALLVTALAAVTGGTGCPSNEGLPGKLPDGFTLPDLSRPGSDMAHATVHVTFPSTARNKIDLLFMVDNSNSMDSMQAELRNRLPGMLKPFQDLADNGMYADLHIGVVTSDYGAGATGAPGCTPSGLSGGGDQGKLIGIGKKAMVSCQKPKGANYVQYQFSQGAPVHNLPVNQNLIETLSCMMSVGAQGCGFEHQLESVYAALHNNIVENQGFLRDDAALAVVFLTNEDDASAPPDTDIFDKNQVAKYGYEDSYSRQTRFAIMCGDPPVFPPYNDSGGALAKCQPAPNPDGISGPGKQFDVQRYQDFFTLPRVQGGVKDNPLDVMLIGIDGPEAPVQVILSNPGTPAGQPFIPCNALNESSNPPCVPVLQHSCVNAQNPAFFGDPAVRINAVIGSVTKHAITSICENDYAPALTEAANLVATGLNPGCITDPLPRDGGGNVVADCQVIEIVVNVDGTEARNALPKCAANDANAPCWKVESKAPCAGTSPDSVGMTVVRGGVPASGRARIDAVCVAK